MNPEEITQLTARSPSDLIDLGESLGTLGASPSEQVPWAFRGQPRTFGTLAPSFQRVFGDRKSVGTAQLIESNLMDAFRTHYTALQERTPNMPQPWAIDRGFDLRCLSVMQHYGVPTRLLDWTSSFWTAVYFACAGDPDADAELWFYDRSIFDSQNVWLAGLGSLRDPNPASAVPEPPLLSHRGLNLVFELDPKITPRMTKQMAHHTVSTEVFADHAPLIFGLSQERSGGSSGTNGFRRVVIAKGCKEKALRFLDEQQSLTASSIFPDVEGLGRFLRWQLDSLLTTLL